MRYLILSLLALAACQKAEVAAPKAATNNPGTNCSGQWASLRMEAGIHPIDWNPTWEDTAKVVQAYFCTDPDVLLVDVAYRGKAVGQSFSIEAAPNAVDTTTNPPTIHAVVRHWWMNGDPAGDHPDTTSTPQLRTGTQHDLRGLRLIGHRVVHIDLQGIGVDYVY